MLPLPQAKKRFGQNFLRDPVITRAIIAAIAPQADQHLLEVGPGNGELTRWLVDRVQHLDAVEIDRDLIAALLPLTVKKSNFSLHNADILGFDLNALKAEPGTLRVIGNLPYNISTPLLFHLLNYKILICDIHVMLQAEVVERIVAQPGRHAYGRLTVMLQYHCQVKKLFVIPPTAFNPVPQVDSALIRLTPYATLPTVAQDYTVFTDIVRLAFSQRRKMLRNTLKSRLDASALRDLAISPMARAEELSVKDYVKISDYLTPKPSSIF